MTGANPENATRGARDRVLQLPDGRQLGYAEFGDPEGIPAVAFHGTPGSRLMFAIIDAVARQWGVRIIAPDRPGYGLSSPTTRPLLEVGPGDTAALMDALDLARVSLIGVSGGGPSALACAAALGARIERLLLVSPLGPVWEPAVARGLKGYFRYVFVQLPRWPRAMAIGFRIMGWLVRTHPDLFVRAIRARAAPADQTILLMYEVRSSLADAMGEGFRTGVSGACADIVSFATPWPFDVARITAPTIVWQGTGDRNVPAQATFLLADRLTHATLHRLDGQGHFWVFGHFRDVLDAAMPKTPPR